MGNETVEEFEKILGQVRKMLALADHPNTNEHEADLARSRAEALMFKYRIQEATVIAHGDMEASDGLVPVWRNMSLYNVGNEFGQSYRSIAGTVMAHVGARARTEWEDGNVVLNACGYQSDLLYAEVLLTSCLLEFGKRLEPKVDETLTSQENAYNMRHAGMERKRIALLLLGQWYTENEMKAKNRRITAWVKAECNKRGEDWSPLLGRGNNMKTYRASYAEGFTTTIWNRLYRMRTAVGVDSAALVLHDRVERVNEAYYERFPEYRPKPPKPVDPNAPQPKVRVRKVKERPFNYAAYDRGGEAARAVDLGPNATGRGRLEEK